MDDPTKFWMRVLRPSPDSCWEWQGGHSHGYGSVWWQGRSRHAHRVAWTLARGPVPDGMGVLHHCDNPPCCNPAHLYLGTDVENARDRVERGRAKGPSGPIVRAPGWNRKVREDDRRGFANRKFTDEQEQEIAARFAAGGVSKSALAREFGVSQPTITQILKRVGAAT